MTHLIYQHLRLLTPPHAACWHVVAGVEVVGVGRVVVVVFGVADVAETSVLPCLVVMVVVGPCHPPGHSRLL